MAVEIVMKKTYLFILRESGKWRFIEVRFRNKLKDQSS